jgi:hypothetical protein
VRQALDLVGWHDVLRPKISQCLFAARCVPTIIGRGRLLSRSYRAKPRLCFGCLRVVHDAPDYSFSSVTEPHIVVVLVPMVRTTAFADTRNRLILECGIDDDVAAGAFELNRGKLPLLFSLAVSCQQRLIVLPPPIEFYLQKY